MATKWNTSGHRAPYDTDLYLLLRRRGGFDLHLVTARHVVLPEESRTIDGITFRSTPAVWVTRGGEEYCRSDRAGEWELFAWAPREEGCPELPRHTYRGRRIYSDDKRRVAYAISRSDGKSVQSGFWSVDDGSAEAEADHLLREVESMDLV